LLLSNDDDDENQLLLTVAVLETTLQWKDSVGHVHVVLDVAAAKEQFLNNMQTTSQAVGMTSNNVKGLLSHDVAVASSLESIQKGAATAMLHDSLPTTPYDDAAALYKLKVMMENEINDMHHVLVGLGVVAFLLLLAFGWTLKQIFKPKTTTTSDGSSSKQQQRSRSVPTIGSTKRPTNCSIPPLSPEPLLEGPVATGKTVQEEDDDNKSLSPCSKHELQWAEHRRRNTAPKPAASRRILAPTKRVMLPDTTKPNPFATTPVAVATPPLRVMDQGLTVPNHEQLERKEQVVEEISITDAVEDTDKENRD
jgi:hypothetical protein